MYRSSKNIALAALLLFGSINIASCAANEPPVPVAVGRSVAAEDEKYVYFLATDEYEDGRDFVDSSLLIHDRVMYDRELGTVTDASAESQLLALVDGKLYLSEANDTDIMSVAAADLVADPVGWRKYSSGAGLETFTHEIAVYVDRLALDCGNPIDGDISSAALDFSDAELFSETERFLVGYDGDYYYIKVVPHHIISDADESISDEAVNEARRYDFVLCRGDDELYTLLTADCGAFSFNSFAAIYDGYVYYPDETGLMRRELTAGSEPEVIYSDYEENERFAETILPIAYESDGGFYMHETATIAPQPSSNLLAVTSDGVYVRDNDGAIFRISHDGGDVVEVAHRYSQTERYFVSGVDGKFKYVSRDGYGIVE